MQNNINFFILFFSPLAHIFWWYSR